MLVTVQTGWSDVVSKVEQVLADVEMCVKDRQTIAGECPFRASSLLHPIHHRSVMSGANLDVKYRKFDFAHVQYTLESNSEQKVTQHIAKM